MEADDTAEPRMTTTVIRQYRDSPPLSLSQDVLQFLVSNYGNRIEIRPAGEGAVVLRGTNYVGLVRAPSYDVLIQPKIPTLSVFWMLGFADRLVRFSPDDFPFSEQTGLLDVLARLFAHQTELILRHGIYRAYVEREENLRFVRGRIVPIEDIRANRGLRHQVACRYSELTADVLHNRILRTVTDQLLRFDFRLAGIRRTLAWNQAHLAEVSPVPVSIRDFGGLRYNRLNDRYRGVLALAELIVRNLTFEFDVGARVAPSFLVDMDGIFQEFLTQLVRETAPAHVRVRSNWRRVLDESGHVPIEPDIVLTEGQRPVAVMDAKYKRLDAQADVYQALAYAKGLGVSRVALLYPADGEVVPADYVVRNDGTQVLVRTIPVGHHGLGFVELERRANDAISAVLRELSAGLGEPREPVQAQVA